MPAEKEMIRLAIEAQVVTQAKLAAAPHAAVIRGGKADFRETLDIAAKMFLPEIDRLLASAGFDHRDKSEYRVWPISKKTLEELDGVVGRRGVPRAAIVRALLVLIGRLNESRPSRGDLKRDLNLENIRVINLD